MSVHSQIRRPDGDSPLSIVRIPFFLVGLIIISFTIVYLLDSRQRTPPGHEEWMLKPSGYYDPSFEPDNYNDRKPFAFEARFLNRHFDYLMHEPMDNVCETRKIRTLVFIISSAKNAEKREAIRNSWMNDKSNPRDYLNLFIIGQVQDPKLSDELVTEQAKYGDIVRYSYEDSYALLPVKVHAAFSWFNKFCSNASYLLKTDDDTVVYEKRLDKFVTANFTQRIENHPSTIFCKLTGGKPIRDPETKYYVSERDYPKAKYPTYCLGGSYMLSRAAVSGILEHTNVVRFNPMEDVLLTGSVAEHANVTRYGARQFGTKKKESPEHKSNETYLSVIIGLRPEKMAPAFRLFKNETLAKSLQYNYHTRPVDL